MSGTLLLGAGGGERIRSDGSGCICINGYPFLGSLACCNFAFGYGSLCSNTTGACNIAIGTCSLRGNTTGIRNIAIGYYAGFNNTGGTDNNSFGVAALCNNTTGSYNNSFGSYSLFTNSSGSCNTGLGGYSLYSNSTSSCNVGLGHRSLYCTIGYGNIGIGVNAGSCTCGGNLNTIIGNQLLGTQGMSGTLLLGAGGGERIRSDGSGCICINS